MVTPLNITNIDSSVSSPENAIINQIKRSGTEKEQLKKTAAEFESVFVTKMLSLMDQTVDKEGGVFGDEGNFLKNFKSFMFDQMGRDISKNPRTSIGFATEIYKQMEKSVKG